MRCVMKRFSNEESGATAIEYGLIAGLISITIIASVTILGTELVTVFTNVKNGFTNGGN